MSALLLTIVVENASPGKAIGVKEAVAMDLEKYGDVKVLQVEVLADEQMELPPRQKLLGKEVGNVCEDHTVRG